MLKCQSQWVFLNRNKGIAKKRKRAMFDPRVERMGALSSTCSLSRAPSYEALAL